MTMGRNARARAIQLPAWNEALGLPRPWDQQWSLRIQQVLAFETDLLEYPDIFEGSKVMDGLVAELVDGAREEMKVVADQGGAVEAVPYMKARLVESHRERVAQDRARGADRRRAEPLHRDRGLAADRRRRRWHPDPGPRGRARARARRSSSGAAERDSEAVGEGARRARGGGRRRVGERDAGDRSPPRRPARPPVSGRRRCATSSATTGPPPGSPAAPRAETARCSPFPLAALPETPVGAR